jgi:hypothetical protein
VELLPLGSLRSPVCLTHRSELIRDGALDPRAGRDGPVLLRRPRRTGEPLTFCRMEFRLQSKHADLYKQQKAAQAALNQVSTFHGRAARPALSTLIVADTSSQFKEDPDAWLLVDKILQEATYPQTKCM